MKIFIGVFLIPIMASTQRIAMSTAFSMIPSAHISSNTFYVQTDTLAGTAFRVEYKGYGYIITAKHLFRSVDRKTGTKIKFKSLEKNSLNTATGTIYVHPNTAIDLAIMFIGPSKKEWNLINIDSLNTYSLGQEIGFLGYYNHLGNISTLGYLPLVKRGYISGTSRQLERDIILGDAFNNDGFSGGPVYTTITDVKGQYILGIVTGNLEEELKPTKLKIDKKIDFTIASNSGIVLIEDIQSAREIMDMIKK
jgi:S1-C subfamily serine protease